MFVMFLEFVANGVKKVGRYAPSSYGRAALVLGLHDIVLSMKYVLWCCYGEFDAVVIYALVE